MDVGSTWTKAVLVRSDGALAGFAENPTTLADVLAGVDAAVRAVVAAAPGAAEPELLACSSAGGGLRLIPGIAREVPNVTECYRITGEDCFFMKVWLHSIDDLEPVLDLFTPHGRTTTSIVHSAPVPARPLPVPAN